MTTFDIDHWISRAQHHRDNNGGYMYESLAVEMAARLGWDTPAKLARQVGNLADAPTLYAHCEPVAEAAALLECLGWAQGVLFAAWFRSLENYREVRDHFPAGPGRTDLRCSA
ncbi:hypothetical protein GA0070616_1339 [Micromonospora nigra]|uniref:Uncharacterized protein n=1 Tax=Micromonospora nigra TaxID=145857 RepID=A0A1C6RKL0_9ACTN|nr:hypothetical protein [Micromonospora nigra]SCL17705.1 hypothetical protein GA0070616_1339 [Micromonospora nigra]